MIQLTLFLPESMRLEIENLAMQENTSVAFMIRKVLKSGLIQNQMQNNFNLVNIEQINQINQEIALLKEQLQKMEDFLKYQFSDEYQTLR